MKKMTRALDSNSKWISSNRHGGKRLLAVGIYKIKLDMMQRYKNEFHLSGLFHYAHYILSWVTSYGFLGSKRAIKRSRSRCLKRRKLTLEERLVIIEFHSKWETGDLFNFIIKKKKVACMTSPRERVKVINKYWVIVLLKLFSDCKATSKWNGSGKCRS